MIDFENVKSAGLVGIETLGIDDQVVILYSVNSNTISFEMHQKIMNCEANVEYYQIRRGGKNSLDFQLSSLLGYLLASGLYTHLYIVSNDSGFDALYDFWTSQYIPTDCVVYRRPNIAMSVAHSAFNTRSLQQNVPSEEAVEVDVTTDDSGAYAQFEMGQEEAEETEPVEIEAEEVPVEETDSQSPETDEPIDEEETAAILAALQAAQLEDEKAETEKKAEAESEIDEKAPAYRGMSAAARMRQAELEAEEEETFSSALLPVQEESPVAPESADEESRPRRRRGRPRRSKPEKDPVSQKEETRRKADPAQVAAISAKLEAELADVCNKEQRGAVAEEILLAEGKQEFYRGIIRRFGQKKGLVVYKAVKSDFVTLKKK